MRRNILFTLLVFTPSCAFRGEDQRGVLLERQRQWIECYNRHDEKKLEEIEADDFRVVFGDSRIQTKAEQITNLRKAVPKGASYEIAIEASEVRIYDGAAVLSGVVVERGNFPDEKGVSQPFRERSRYTDTWILRTGKWRVVSSHLSGLK